MRLPSSVRGRRRVSSLSITISILSKCDLQKCTDATIGASARVRASYLNDNLRVPPEPANGWRSGAPASTLSGPNQSNSRAVSPCSPRESCMKLNRNKFSFAPEIFLPCSVVRRNSCRRRKLRSRSRSRTSRRNLDAVQRIRIVQQLGIARNIISKSTNPCYEKENPDKPDFFVDNRRYRAGTRAVLAVIRILVSSRTSFRRRHIPI